MPPASFDFFTYVKDGGAYCSPLLLAALLWMVRERKDLLAKLEAKSAKVENLTERMIVLMTELKVWLGGKGAGR